MCCFPGFLITSPKPDHEATDITAELSISVTVLTFPRPVSKLEACWTDGERMVRPCRYHGVGALRRFLPASSSSLTNKTANYLRSSTVAVNHTLCSSVLETSMRSLGAVTERVHCPATAAAAAAGLPPASEQTDRPTVCLSPPLPLSPPPPHTSLLHPAFPPPRFLSFLHPMSETHL